MKAQTGNLKGAIVSYTDASGMFDAAGDGAGKADALWGLAKVQTAAGRTEEAKATLGEFYKLHVSPKDRRDAQKTYQSDDPNLWK